MRQLHRTPSPIAESLVAPSSGRGCTSLQPRSVAGAALFQRSNLSRIVWRRRERRRRGRSAGNREAEGGLNHNGSGGGRFVVLFLALFLVEPSHAQEAPNLAFVSEYIRELGVNERMRALGERELTEVGGNHQFAALIRSSTRIQLELGAQIHKLSGIHLKPPFEDLVPVLGTKPRPGIIAPHTTRWSVSVKPAPAESVVFEDSDLRRQLAGPRAG